MAGHSKWHNIQHRKGAQDAKRGKVFTKLIKEIVIAAKAGGGVIENNPGLRMVIDKALAANMKRDTIESAVKRGSGDLEGENYDEVRYEGYGLGGTAIMVDTLTDNRNRTVADVRHAFTKHGGNLGTDGSVSYLFTKQGFISFATGANEDAIMEAALDAGADDVVTNDDGSIDVLTSPEDFFTVKDALTEAGLESSHAEVTMEPANRVELNLGDAEKFMKLIDRLEDLDDTQEVYHNADISDEVMAQL
ncbi:YebC/PmpR family DNA-binding transcriptional regulator [Candidatus Thioglobus sp.]|jgi:YebC/PmpR family DNA-binding regulatory protein|uniref:YebC/PmpR family DNA-binding transcriptional regulator n=1 Tax=Candidatus Thioglobus sp. TaxID=2026721 RepID=UPI001D94E94F|nr:YebC/PmpR family DNA-binding transcriptional regulator [Candidatus Thioglobus sp.]MBT3277103.1 YebC/PmpR family DNA-binding transcriptional regulator [Candidatus Thioglobus sp.]MBT3447465.1 YebC/PmpR family DNA-binding transcriptional regulator [Candidatus Thioglobus sp.]MBT3744527.1 YebC/PmpR family DNA-binding transcriptional regulator [Candidatus Thioglobus sp.]MBT4001581.1 YebC/PmpR family DNA-binding transcriptional regulator [Candidatus Thioglobus sp.]MBT4181343.1 YebC/PmpR family DNA